MPESLIDVVALKKYFPIRGGLIKREVGAVRAVDDIDLTIYKGETLGLVGESGCGKTTVGRSILKLIEATDGAVYKGLPPDKRAGIGETWKTIREKEEAIAKDQGHEKALRAEIRQLHEKAREFAGPHDLSNLKKKDLRALRREMQIVFQDPFSSLNPRLIVRDIIGEALLVHKVKRWWCRNCNHVVELAAGQGDGGVGTEAPTMKCEVCGESMVIKAVAITGKELRDRVTALLARVGLNPEHLYRFPHEFSGGQRQRLGIARALALNPSFIVLDEPTSALDVSVQAQILNLLKDLQREMGLTFLFISHHLAVVRHISDRVAVMYLGKIVESASTESLFTKPLHPYTQALLSAVPVPDPDSKRERIILSGDVPSPANPPAGCRFHPRCPVAFAKCGWTPSEIITDLDKAFQRREDEGALEPRMVETVKIEGSDIRLSVMEGSVDKVRVFLDHVLTEGSEGFRGYRAIDSVTKDGDSIVLHLHPFVEPELKEVASGHLVSCHLY